VGRFDGPFFEWFVAKKAVGAQHSASCCPE
jgi:hypothetical protein